MSKVEKFSKRKRSEGLQVLLWNPVEFEVMGIPQKLDAKEIISLLIENSRSAATGIANIRESIKFIDALESTEYCGYLTVSKNVAKWLTEGFDAIQWKGQMAFRKEFLVVLELIESLKTYVNENPK